MQVKWLADDRDVVTGDARQEVSVSRGDVIDLQVDVARSVIDQGLAEMKNKPKKRAPKAAQKSEE